MNDRVTISLLQLFEMFPDEDKAREYLESRLWPDVGCVARAPLTSLCQLRRNAFGRRVKIRYWGEV